MRGRKPYRRRRQRRSLSGFIDAMAALAKGDWLLLRYDVPGPELWHERLVVAVSQQQGWACVVTPDHDIFMEQVSNANRDLLGFRKLTGRGREGGI